MMTPAGGIIQNTVRAAQRKGQHLMYMQPGHSEGNHEVRVMAISLGLPRKTRGVNIVHGVLDDVLQKVPRPTASISQEKVPLRFQIQWTNVHEWDLEDKRGGEQVLDAEVQVELPTLRETEPPMLHEALLDLHC